MILRHPWQTPAPPGERLLDTRDWPGLARYLGERFALALDPDWVQDYFEALRGVVCSGWPLGIGWSEGTWFTWFKARLADAGRFAVDHADPPPVRLTVPLHFGFVALAETEEMLARLAVEPEITRRLDRYEQACRDSETAAPARSKIGRTEQLIHPIDAVAIRIAPGFERPDPHQRSDR